MPRSQPTSKIDIIGNLDLKPLEAVDEYYESKLQDAYFIKPPNWDSAGDSIELLFIRNEREHEAMLRLQQEMIDNTKRESKVNKNRTHRLYNMQNKLRKRFIDVNSFIKDCVDKKRTAEKKIDEETALHKELRSNIQKYKRSIEELTAFREVLKDTVKEFEPYERVIEEVVEKSDIFVSVKDCMDRCDALMLAQVEISHLEQQKLQEIEEMRKRMVKITNEAALTVLGLKNDLAELERSYNQARSECLKWEKILATARNCVAHNDLNKDRVLDGIHHMYRMLCKRRNMDPLFQRHEVERQLDFIKHEVEVLNAVLKEINDEKGPTKSEYLTEKANVKC